MTKKNAHQDTVAITDQVEVASTLRQAAHVRLKLGRNEMRDRAKEVERAREAGNIRRQRQLEERDDRAKSAYTRRKRQLETLEREQEHRRLGAAIRREDRRAFKRQPPASLFVQFEKVARGTAPMRELYYDWIGRGFGSGKSRAVTRGAKKRTSARTTRWKSGEMGRKIRYICRAEALEDIEGKTLTNMGEDLAEAVHCSTALERVERLSRKDAQVYVHVIVALSHENTPAERAEVLAELVRPLAAMKLPYCAALHKPDPRGDQRNYHAHVILSLRPMERMAPYEWEFSASKSTWLNTTGGLLLQRKFVARTLNRSLAAAGHEGRWTHRSRESRGGQNPGNTKKGPERTRQERAEQDAAKLAKERRETFLLSSFIHRSLSRLLEASELMEECLQNVVDVARAMQTSFSSSLSDLEADLGELAASVLRPVEVDPKARTDAQTVLAVSASLRDVEKCAAQALTRDNGPELSAQIERVREAVVSGKIGTRSSGDDRYKVAACDHDLLSDWIALIKTREGQVYCREIIDALPEIEDEQSAWPAINMTRDPSLDEAAEDTLYEIWRRRVEQGIG